MENLKEKQELKKYPFCYPSFKEALSEMEILTVRYAKAEEQYDRLMVSFVIGVSKRPDACVCQELLNMIYLMRMVTKIQVNILSVITNSLVDSLKEFPQNPINEKNQNAFEILELLDKYYEMLKLRCNRVLDRDFTAKNSQICDLVGSILEEEMKCIIRNKYRFEHIIINLQCRRCCTHFDKAHIVYDEVYNNIARYSLANIEFEDIIAQYTNPHKQQYPIPLAGPPV